MARTVQECNDYIVTNLVTEFAAVGITIDPNLWSKRNLLRNICYTFAIAQSLFEQLADISIAAMQDIQTKSAAATKAWIQDKMFKFQYSATTPQYVQMVNGIPQYPVVNDTLKIITACSVATSVTQTVNIKVAKGDPLSALAAGELTAAQDYIDTIGTAGINYVVLSDDADKLYIEANIYYRGSYAAVIQANVIDAIDAYLLNLSRTDFNGYIYVADLVKMIDNIEGVNDVELVNVKARYDSQSFGAGIDLVTAGDVVQRRYLAGAGYLIQEDTVGYTFADSLTFIAE
jgi:hypothetical protein